MSVPAFHLHAFPFVHTAAIEVTSKCNLQCTYCKVSQPDYRGLDMPGWMIDELLPELRARQMQQLCINGHGETTARRGWHETFEALVTALRINIITNLARPLLVDEVAFLSRIDSIGVSLDTVDASRLKEIRRSLDLDVLVKNLDDIRCAAERNGRRCPSLILYAGVYDKNVMQLEALMDFAIAKAFSRVIFWSLVKHPDVAGASNVSTLLELPAEDQRKAKAVIESSARALEARGIPYEFVGDFFEIFKRHIDDHSPRPAARVNRIFLAASQGFTKDCFDPWNYSQIKANGEVYPCCTHSAVGRVDREHRYKDILDGPALQSLRQRLLTGQLDDECRCCHMRANIPISEFQATYLQTFRRSPHDLTPIAVPPWRIENVKDRGWLAKLSTTCRSAARTVRLGIWSGGILAHLDSPAAGQVCSRRLKLTGWCFSPKGLPVTGRVFVERCGFSEQVPCDRLPFVADCVEVAVEVRDAEGGTLILGPVAVRRADATESGAGVLSREQDAWLQHDRIEFCRPDAGLAAHVRARVGILSTDTVLEIGCGAGRIARHLAPWCATWIGVDISAQVLEIARTQLAGFRNVELIQTTGYDLLPVPDGTVDVVYCFLIFMLLPEWDRFNYVAEARRVLKPDGRLLVDTMNLLGDASWDIFSQIARMHPHLRPSNLCRTATPEELKTYFFRAGFEQVETVSGGMFVECVGKKPA